MKKCYKIYGYDLNINFENDEKLIKCFDKYVGVYVCNNNDGIGEISFVSSTRENINEMFRKCDKETVKKVYVEPTGEEGIIVICPNNNVIHYYEGYYYVEYIYDKGKVEFYYTDMFYEIEILLMEFLKYYIFYFAVQKGEYPIHSSCVSSVNNEAILFVGDSGCGKSSNAILAGMDQNYYFCGDEVTYLQMKNGDFWVRPAMDKVKVCENMFMHLKQLNFSFGYEKLDKEYVCDLHLIRNRDNLDCFLLKGLVLLERDDNMKEIVKLTPNILLKNEILSRNFNISIWTTEEQRKKIVALANNLLLKSRIIYIKYPTNKINEVFEFVKKEWG